ncbi:MAG: hypothetical protein WBO10_02255 [Pyrinomonadaceae bacterium]
MRSFSKLITTAILIFAFLSSALPCGPGYISPMFDTASAPENPYTDYAAGRLGIVKPGFRRSVLYAAYRYIAGGGMTTPEQQAMIEVWNAEIDNRDFPDDPIDPVIKAWVEQRGKVELKEEKPPKIYTEREYGGYDFFPNCTKNAFETATETLSDRLGSHGPSDNSVKDWVNAQDQVFQNCASGKRTPDDAPMGAPEWLQKDRAYQKAAAEFYSLDYASAKKRFAEIAEDSDSPWQETADYLVARTLIRQASLSKDATKAAPLYDEAETHLAKFVSRSGKFANSAERLTALIKYRRHPKERVSELANKLTYYGGDDNFRQDVIDYTWLLDKFESEMLRDEDKRKQAEKERERQVSAADGVNSANTAYNAANAAANAMTNAANTAANAVGGTSSTGYTVTNRAYPRAEPKNDDDLELTLYSTDYGQSWRFYIKPDATDDEAIAEAEKAVGQPLTDEMKQRVRNMRQSAYAGRFTATQNDNYEGGYWGEEKLSPSLISDDLRKDDLTDWLYTYQMSGAEAYLYSLDKFKVHGGSLWLMTAISKADKSSTQLPRLLEAAEEISRSSPAWTTISFHRARILLQLGKTAEAKRLLDEMLATRDELTTSARNSVMSLRLNMAETLEDFLKFSLKKPFAFDFSGDVGTIEDIIAREKSWYDPETYKDGREAYDRQVEERYREHREWQGRHLFDDETIDVFNQHFPTTQLIEVFRSPGLPDYMRDRFAIAVWTRAFLLNDAASLSKMTNELAKYRPELAKALEPVAAAKTTAARENAMLYFLLKNPLLSPYVETGIGKENNEQEAWSSDDWWCAPYDTQYNDATNSEQPSPLPPRPAFLTAAQSKLAQAERKRLKTIGDAPKYLGERVLAWAKRAPRDTRVPEALYISIEANGWNKYGCGNNVELRNDLVGYLKTRYPKSEWAAKLVEENEGR